VISRPQMIQAHGSYVGAEGRRSESPATASEAAARAQAGAASGRSRARVRPAGASRVWSTFVAATNR
jgi:hypothetical protein